MADRYSLKDIELLAGRKLFVDANVLLYIFWPTGQAHWESAYSSVFGRLLRRKNELIINFMVISEVVNKAMDMEYNKYMQSKKTYLHKKQYRNSDDGQSAMDDIFLLIRESILPHFSVHEKDFSKAEIHSFLNVEPLDFIDKGILEICKCNNLVLLTNDVDFAHTGIDILSSNPALIKH